VRFADYVKQSIALDLESSCVEDKLDVPLEGELDRSVVHSKSFGSGGFAWTELQHWLGTGRQLSAFTQHRFLLVSLRRQRRHFKGRNRGRETGCA
jgi:hypothetical protein